MPEYLLIHSFGCFRVSAIVEKVSTNIREQISVWAEVFLFFGETPRRVITDLSAEHVFSFVRKFSLQHCGLPLAAHESSLRRLALSG